MPKPKQFEEKYPTIHRFVEEIGLIEIGQHEMRSSFVQAYNLGGTVYEGKDSYPASKLHSKTWKWESKPIWMSIAFSAGSNP